MSRTNQNVEPHGPRSGLAFLLPLLLAAALVAGCATTSSPRQGQANGTAARSDREAALRVQIDRHCAEDPEIPSERCTDAMKAELARKCSGPTPLCDVHGLLRLERARDAHRAEREGQPLHRIDDDDPNEQPGER